MSTNQAISSLVSYPNNQAYTGVQHTDATTAKTMDQRLLQERTMVLPESDPGEVGGM